MSRARNFADLAGSADAGGLTGRNLIINGAMQVAQRSTSVTGIGGANGFFTVDRWQIFQGGSTSGRLTQSQESVTDLAGFPNSLKHEVTTADTSIAAGELLQISQTFEGQNLQALKKGYSDASSFTVSFYVKGTAKTYVVEMYDGDNNRHVAQTFSVTSSWSRVELTFPADTTGKFDDDNGLSLYLIIWLHAGSTYTSGTLPSTWASATNANRAVGAGSLFSATSNTFEITGAQLEVGEKATPFEHRSFGDELRRCQRYFEVLTNCGPNGVVSWEWGVNASQWHNWYFHTTKRAAPTIVSNTGWNINTPSVNGSNVDMIQWSAGGAFYWAGTDGNIIATADAEL